MPSTRRGESFGEEPKSKKKLKSKTSSHHRDKGKERDDKSRKVRKGDKGKKRHDHKSRRSLIKDPLHSSHPTVRHPERHKKIDPRRLSPKERCGLLCGRIKSSFSTKCPRLSSWISGTTESTWWEKMSRCYRHPLVRIFTISSLATLDITSYLEDPICYSQTSVSVPIVGLAINGLGLSYVNPSSYPRYFAYQLLSQLFFVLTFVLLGELLVRRTLFQKILNFRAFKENKGVLFLSLIWAVLGLWFAATVTNYLVAPTREHTWQGFLDFVADENPSGYKVETNYSSFSTTGDPNSSRSPDLTFKFLRWMGVINYTSVGTDAPLDRIEYSTPLRIKSEIPMSNETFCRISRILVSLGNAFTFFSIIDMILQDKRWYPKCFYKVKSTGCWDRQRVKSFWIFMFAVVLGLSITAEFSLGWKSLKGAQIQDWKGKPVDRMEFDSFNYSKPTLESKDSVLLALDNEGQMPADRFTLYESTIWKLDLPHTWLNGSLPTKLGHNDTQIRVPTIFSNRIIDVNDEGGDQSLHLWLSENNMYEQRLIGGMTKNLMFDYKEGLLSDLSDRSPVAFATESPFRSEVERNELLLGKLKPLMESEKFRPIREKSESWEKSRGYFDTTETERIIMKIFILLLDAMVLHQDPQFPHFDEGKKKKKKRKEEEDEEDEDEDLKLVGLDGSSVTCKSLADTLKSCFSCNCRKRSTRRKVEEGEENSDSWDFSGDFFDTSSSEELYGDEVSYSGKKSCGGRNCRLNFGEAIDNCLPVLGLGKTKEEKESPHLKNFGGEANRYKFNRSPIARICCSCCNKKPKMSEETANIRAKSLCARSCKNFWCCVPNISVFSNLRDPQRETATTTIINQRHKRDKVTKRQKFITATSLTYYVFLVVLLINLGDNIQQISYDPSNYGQIVDSNGRIHSVYPNGGFFSPSEYNYSDIAFSSLHLMGPHEVRVTVESIHANTSISNSSRFPNSLLIWSSGTPSSLDGSLGIFSPAEYSKTYGKEPHVIYSSKHVGWDVTLSEFYSTYGDLIIADGTIQKNPLGYDYTLDIIFDFIRSKNDNETKIKDDDDNLNRLTELKTSVSKRIEWLYVYDETSSTFLDPKDLTLEEVCPFSSQNKVNVTIKDTTYKAYGVSCKCWKQTGFTSNGAFKPEGQSPTEITKKALDGVYDLEKHGGKTLKGKYSLDSLWENGKVRTSDNVLSYLRFQNVADGSRSPALLGEIDKCDVSGKHSPGDSKFPSFLNVNKDVYASSYLSDEPPICVSLEVHTLIAKRSSLSKILSKANKLTNWKYNQTCESRPFLDTKWLEHCHTYSEEVDVRCGPCYQIESEESISIKNKIGNLMNHPSTKNKLGDDDGEDYNYVSPLYEYKKKRLSFLVDLWEPSDEIPNFNETKEANEIKDLGFWFGHKEETLLLEEGYSPSSDKAYVNEELPVLLTQRFSPILTLGPLNIRFLFVPFEAKIALAILPISLVLLLLLKIAISFSYGSLKSWERKMQKKLEDFNQIHTASSDEGHVSLEGDEGILLQLNKPKYKFIRFKLKLLYCCRKLHRSDKKTLNPDLGITHYPFEDDDSNSPWWCPTKLRCYRFCYGCCYRKCLCCFAAKKSTVDLQEVTIDKKRNDSMYEYL